MFVESIALPQLQELVRSRLESYVIELPAVRALTRGPFAFRRPVAVIVGDNGAGKSTLMEALALALEFDAIGGPRFGFDGMSRRARTGSESSLANYLLVERQQPDLFGGFFLRAETQMNLVDFADSPVARGGRLGAQHSLTSRSHGESIFDLIDAYMTGPGLYLLDEPEAGLSVVRQMALLAEIHRLADSGGQVIVATHSPILAAIPGADLVEVTDAGLVRIDFDEVEAVRATREFFEDPAGIAQYLIADPED